VREDGEVRGSSGCEKEVQGIELGFYKEGRGGESGSRHWPSMARGRPVAQGVQGGGLMGKE
jgi:hypothetical protein